MSGQAPQPVWAKRVGDAAATARNIGYTAGFDVVGRSAADARLTPFDLQTNAAHLIMLAEEGIVPHPLAARAAKGLLEARDQYLAGMPILRPECEDIHMSTEVLVGELVGTEAAGYLHTGRSRNDQVATDMRLWLRAVVLHFGSSLGVLAEAIATHARQHLHTVCPGFTHGQPAMVTTWGHWTMSYLPRLLRDARELACLLRELKTCPLGAAASFGTSWPLNRKRTAELLGFSHPTPSGADGIWSRGELEQRFASLASRFLAHLSGVAQDIILLSSPPREWLRLADEHVTGSSIMPQKRNPDFAEVTRARAHVAAGLASSLLGIGTAAQSGYNRDSQWTKYLAFDAADNLAGAPEIFADVFAGISVDAPKMRAACDEGFLNATDVADFLARARQLPFRQCYRIIGGAVRACDEGGRLQRRILNEFLAKDGIAEVSLAEWAPLEDPVALLMARTQPGSPHPEHTHASIDVLRGEIAKALADMDEFKTRLMLVDARLWSTLQELGK